MKEEGKFFGNFEIVELEGDGGVLAIGVEIVSDNFGVFEFGKFRDEKSQFAIRRYGGGDGVRHDVFS